MRVRIICRGKKNASKLNAPEIVPILRVPSYASDNLCSGPFAFYSFFLPFSADFVRFVFCCCVHVTSVFCTCRAYEPRDLRLRRPNICICILLTSSYVCGIFYSQTHPHTKCILNIIYRVFYTYLTNVKTFVLFIISPPFFSIINTTVLCYNKSVLKYFLGFWNKKLFNF